ncbi:cytochrome P450 [Annulohypoxylon maeteangense]|uniref:cytochrome P450 n=1 Tax=Annulohypoxylon maeteangense TaxID=1927788 RepID=UPI00200865F5|nr:cytochrome P450 [Annulohypoxylon maeteangense]KAI0884179.1 cytochrome P450 [Annulohypoxylon maeteangense]
MDAVKKLLGCTCSVLVLYYVIAFGYRLLFHPLRKYPGPFIAKLTEVYGGFFALTKSLHIETYKSHLKYGPVVRQAPNRLVFNSATALQAIYKNDLLAKSYVYSAAQPDQHNIFTTTSKAEHRPKRRLVSQVLSDQSMRSFEPTLLAQIDVFLKMLLQSNEVPVNMSPTFRFLGFNIAGLLGFGYDLHLQTDDTYRYLADAITLGSYRVNACMQFAFLASLKPGRILGLFPNSLHTRLFDMIRTMVSSRLAQPIDAQHDLLATFHKQSKSDNQEMKLNDIWNEGFLLFGAGGDTTASTLSAAFFYLSRNEECYQKLSEEIRSTFNSGSEIRGGPRLTGCRYLRACIDETLRMSPPIPGTLWREPQIDSKQRPVIVDGHVIPPGTQIGVNIYSLHHNEKYFPDAFKFQPERWLEGSKNASHEAMTPFSIGPRGCAGKALSYLEISLVLAKVFWYFDFETASGDIKEKGLKISENEFPTYDNFSLQHDGPHLVYRPRDSAKLDLIAE